MTPSDPAQAATELTLVDDLLRGTDAARRRALATAITLLESTRPDHRPRQETLLAAVLPRTGGALRVAISGPPGAGKSTLIELLGLHIVEQGRRVAVLAIDPSSPRSGGSILGDKTRMERLSMNSGAFVRPSPSGTRAGGVAWATREAILLCEAAGYDVVIVETVGSGQNEVTAGTMTDMLVVLQPPHGGDGLQAVKRGLMEMADLVVISKADVDATAAARTQAEIAGLLTAVRKVAPAIIAFTAVGDLAVQATNALWQGIQAFHEERTQNGQMTARRTEQNLAWMWERIESGLRERFRARPDVESHLSTIADEVRAGRMTASDAARFLLDLAG